MNQNDIVSVMAAILYAGQKITDEDPSQLDRHSDECVDRAWDLFYKTRKRAEEGLRRHGKPAGKPL
ncbi:MAG: hypothetical protein L0099_04105 [Acidobacteria bacterium]|nr:hypothetical protein [Acidobacteriota bacterium]